MGMELIKTLQVDSTTASFGMGVLRLFSYYKILSSLSSHE